MIRSMTRSQATTRVRTQTPSATDAVVELSEAELAAVSGGVFFFNSAILAQSVEQGAKEVMKVNSAMGSKSPP
jgi:hypothetical protein